MVWAWRNGKSDDYLYLYYLLFYILCLNIFFFILCFSFFIYCIYIRIVVWGEQLLHFILRLKTDCISSSTIYIGVPYLIQRSSDVYRTALNDLIYNIGNGLHEVRVGKLTGKKTGKFKKKIPKHWIHNNLNSRDEELIKSHELQVFMKKWNDKKKTKAFKKS